MGNRVVHFEIQADNPERAKKFYEQTFGWKIEKWKGEGMDYWMLMTGDKNEMGINGGMYKRPEDRKLNTFDCTIAVENIDNCIQMIKKNGGTIAREKAELPGVGWLATAMDTEGNIFGILQPSPMM